VHRSARCEIGRLGRARRLSRSLGRALAAVFGRERAKDTTLDYTRAFAERRGIEVPFEVQQEAPRQVAREVPGRKRGMFAGLKLEGRSRLPDHDRGPAEPAVRSDRPAGEAAGATAPVGSDLCAGVGGHGADG